jgi:excisionase family DNA binding protein
MFAWYREGMLTVADAARITGKNPETIRRWIRSGRLNARKFGTQHVIDEIELDELVNGIRAEGVPDWLRDGLAEQGIDVDDIVRMVREDRDEH